MNEKQIEVLKWWHGDREYQLGVMLLSRFGKNKVLVHTLMKPGKERFGGTDKLYYELPKAVGLNFRKMPPLLDGVAPEPEQKRKPLYIPTLTGTIVIEKNRDDKFIPLISGKPLDQYPKIIRRIKYEYSDLYKQRSLLHKEMRGIAEANSPTNMTARQNLFGEIKAISLSMDRLYLFIAAYEKNGTLPLEEVVWPDSEAEKEFPNDVVELKKLKKNLQSANTKERNRLLYQQRTIAEKENPMPKGPKRQKYELKIKKREKLIVAIENKIVELEYAG